MRLFGYSLVSGNSGTGPFPPSGRNTGSGFLDEMKKTGEAARVKKIKDAVELSEGGLEAVYEHLSPASKNVLERLNDGRSNIQKDEWLGLCKELKDAGVITQSDFDYTRPDLHLIPLGYHDENGNFVQYDTPPMLKDRLTELYERSRSSNGAEAVWTGGSWTGDPLEYLDLWSSELYNWRSDLARARNDDGTPKFNNFSPITDQINSCQKVTALVRELCKF